MSDTIPNPIEVVEQKKKAAIARYRAAMHAMQTGVAVQMVTDPDEAATSPKHLRVGVNSALVDNSALAQLLIDKNIITELEYFEALAAMAEAEQEKYEKMIGHKLA